MKKYLLLAISLGLVSISHAGNDMRCFMDGDITHSTPCQFKLISEKKGGLTKVSYNSKKFGTYTRIFDYHQKDNLNGLPAKVTDHVDYECLKTSRVNFCHTYGLDAQD